MQPDEVEAVVAGLNEKGFFAHVHRATPGRVGVRVVLPGGANALWDVDGAAGLEAMVMRDGVLVGFVPTIPGSADFTTEQSIEAIAAADYGLPS